MLKKIGTIKFPSIDARYFQIYNNSAIILYGYFFLDFERRFSLIPLAVILSILADYIFSKIFDSARAKRTISDRLISVFNTTLSISAIMNLISPEYYVYAIVTGIISKFLFRVNGRHVFNPANFGIVAGFVLYPATSLSIEYSQFFANSPFLTFFAIFNGILICSYAKRLTLAFSYIIFNSALLYIFSPYFGFDSTFLIGVGFNISGLLFMFFMITDPKTSPKSQKGQIVFGGIVALIAAFFRMNQMVHDMFVALFVTSALYSLWLIYEGRTELRSQSQLAAYPSV